MRVLIASTEGAGHLHPLVPFIEAVVRRGDEVLVVVPPALRATVEAAGHPVRVGADPPAAELTEIWQRVPTAPPEEAAALVNREIFGRLCTAAMLPTLERACFEWRPDLILREPCEYASAVAAERLGVPHVQVAISLADVEASSLALAAPVLEPYGSRMVSQIRASPYLTRFPASLDASPFIVTRRFRELAGGSREPLPSWWGDGDEPLLYVTFGSIAGVLPIGEGAYRAALAAVAGLHTRVLLTIGRTTDRSTLGPIPANVHVEAWVPQSDVFRHATAVACHGGSGTTFGALAAGLPLVFVPLFADQPTNARRVSAGGAGLVVEFDSFREAASTIGLEDAPRIRTAIETVLADASYREAASRIALEMRGYPSVDEALATLIDRDV